MASGSTASLRPRMHAAVVEHFGQSLDMRELDIPIAGAGQIVVRTEVCGVCHADLQAARGRWLLQPTLPFTPGHEAVGIVTEVGPGVKIVREGDRVGVPWVYTPCGHCESCRSTSRAICPNARFGGYTNGGFAEYILADPSCVVPIPKGLAPADAAPLICAGVATYRGLKQTAALPGEWVAIFGFAGHGHLAVQYAKAMGLLVCAIDSDAAKLAHAQTLGADLLINSSDGDPATAVRKGTGGGSHGVLITTRSSSTFAQGIGMARKSGTCVLVGLPLGEFPQPFFHGVINSIMIRGSFAGNREDIFEALSFAVDGTVKADVELQQLSTINEIFRRIDRGEVSKHVVLDVENAERARQDAVIEHISPTKKSPITLCPKA